MVGDGALDALAVHAHARQAALRLRRAEPVRGVVDLREREPVQHQQVLLARPRGDEDQLALLTYRR